MSVYNKTPYIVSVLSSLTQELQNALQVLIDTKSEPKLYSLINDDYKITTEDKGVKFIQLECNDKVITGYLVYNNTYCVIFGFNASQKVEIYNVDYANRKIEKIEEECSILEFRAVLEHLSLAASAGLKREIVETLPVENIDPNVIYMVLDSEATGDNVYNEYLYIGDAWELIGNTGVVETGNTIAWANIDLTSGTASKTPTEAEWLLMTDDESDCKLVLTLSTNEVVRLERVSLTSSTVLFSAVASDTRYTATFTESDNVLSGVITAKDTSVQGNPTIPAGATVNPLNALKIGSNYFNIDKPIHFIKLTSTTLTEALRSEILSDEYFVVLEYDGIYYYEHGKGTNGKTFISIPTTSSSSNNRVRISYTLGDVSTTSLTITLSGYTRDCIQNKALPINIAGKDNSNNNVSAGKVLTADGSGGTSWESVSGGMSNPMISMGDLIIGGVNGTPMALPKGTTGQVLKATATSVEWSNESAGSSGYKLSLYNYGTSFSVQVYFSNGTSSTYSSEVILTGVSAFKVTSADGIILDEGIVFNGSAINMTGDTLTTSTTYLLHCDSVVINEA